MPRRPGAGRPPFGDEPLVPLHVSITAEQRAWLEKQATAQGVGVSQVVRNIISFANADSLRQPLPEA